MESEAAASDSKPQGVQGTKGARVCGDNEWFTEPRWAQVQRESDFLIAFL